ncbi:alpha/beta fold hydrolase [Coralloluteibacterium thermophilus]|uniref:Alpha/beta fold hydrolase n=1 Tax=Coralloluteibacterium thermophilum TaxID=2707049 RepID=A0ABV9NKC4_9GAMM
MPPPPPPALFLHGAGGGGWEWAIWRRVFAAAGWRTVAPDLSPVAGGLAATRFEDYLAQVQALCRAGPPPLLVGASLGGLLAAAAAGAGTAVAGLVLVNPAPPAPWHPGQPAPSPPVRAWRGRASLAGTRRAMPDADPATVLYALRRWRDESGAVLDAVARGLAVAPAACPCLVVIGGADRDVAPVAMRAMAGAWAAETIEVPGLAHLDPLLGRSAAILAARACAWAGARSE